MPSTSLKGYEVQTTGTNSGTWGSTLNDNMIEYLDLNMAGVNSQSLSSSNVTLTTSESRRLVVRCTGTLLANITITTPGLGFYIIDNQTTGSFTLTLQYTGGVGGTPTIPQGGVTLVVIDSTNGVRIVLPGDLMAIEALTATSGILKKTAANTWSLSTGVTDLAATTANRLFGTNGSGTSGLIATDGTSVTLASSTVSVIPATEANMEAQASTAPVYPNVQKFHPGHPKACGAGTSAGAINGTAFNVASITRNSAGNYTVVMSVGMTSTAYFVLATADSTGAPASQISSASYEITNETTFVIRTTRPTSSGSSAFDAPFSFAVFGTQ